MDRYDSLIRILQPALKLCLRKMFKFQEFLEFAKRVFIRLATEELEKNGQKVTVSALSVMTGIRRHEVNRCSCCD